MCKRNVSFRRVIHPRRQIKSMTDPAEEAQARNWIEIQDELRKRLITQDDFPWKIPLNSNDDRAQDYLKYVGGVDISFSKEDSSVACGCLVVLELNTLQLVYHDLSMLRVEVPYVPGFLAFREAPILLQLLDKMKKDANRFYPQVLLVDGNGLLHPRGFGLACHLGVLANLPTIGIGKNLHHVDGLTQSTVRKLLQEKEDKCNEDIVSLTGASGFTWGAAVRSTKDTLKPIFISIGHRISLDAAIRVVKLTCKYRVPEPIRQADIRSREYLQKHQTEK